MKTFNLKKPTCESEKLISDLMEKLLKNTDDFMLKNIEKNPERALSALQSAGVNYIYAITGSCYKFLKSKSRQLDYIDEVKEDVIRILDSIKIHIKSVDLN
jgi:uncharacterized membrane protein YgaE (UPF0421/DUF939 family)